MPMTPCPSDEKLTALLADALSVGERDAVARHVEECSSCQEQLARLAETPDAKAWRLTEHPLRSSGAEEEVMQRLKQMPSELPATAPMQAATRAGDSPH